MQEDTSGQRWTQEIIGVDVEPVELEKINRRLQALREALPRLEPLIGGDAEPLTMAVLEDE